VSILQTKPRDWFKPDPKQPRSSVDEDEINRLGDDMLARGVLVPLLARADGNHGIIIDGWRRWLAAVKMGIPELPVLISDKLQTEMEVRGIQIATAIHRADLTGYEKWMACTELLCLNPTWQLLDLSKFLHLGASTITKLMSPSKCSPAWREALAAGTVGIGDCYAASGLPEAEQSDLLTMKLSGASRDDLAQAGRKHRNGSKPSVKLTRVKCTLPISGVTLIASGAGLSLDDLIESFSEAQKEARKARDQGQDIKSFQAVMTAKSIKQGVGAASDGGIQ